MQISFAKQMSCNGVELSLDSLYNKIHEIYPELFLLAQTHIYFQSYEYYYKSSTPLI